MKLQTKLGIFAIFALSAVAVNQARAEEPTPAADQVVQDERTYLKEEIKADEDSARDLKQDVADKKHEITDLGNKFEDATPDVKEQLAKQISDLGHLIRDDEEDAQDNLDAAKELKGELADVDQKGAMSEVVQGYEDAIKLRDALSGPVGATDPRIAVNDAKASAISTEPASATPDSTAPAAGASTTGN